MVEKLLLLAKQSSAFVQQRPESWLSGIESNVRSAIATDAGSLPALLAMLSNFYANKALSAMRNYEAEEVDWKCVGLSFEYLRLSLRFSEVYTYKASSVDIANWLSLGLFARLSNRVDMLSLAAKYLPSDIKKYDKQSGKIRFSDVYKLLMTEDCSDVKGGYYWDYFHISDDVTLSLADMIDDHLAACKNVSDNKPILNLLGSVIPLDILLFIVLKGDAEDAGGIFSEFKNRIGSLNYCNDGLVCELDVLS